MNVSFVYHGNNNIHALKAKDQNCRFIIATVILHIH